MATTVIELTRKTPTQLTDGTVEALLQVRGANDFRCASSATTPTDLNAYVVVSEVSAPIGSPLWGWSNGTDPVSVVVLTAE